MLVKLIQKMNAEVSRFNLEAAVPAFVSEWLRMRPDAKAQIAKNVPGKNDSTRQGVVDGVLVSMAKGALGRIKKIPEMTTVMIERLQSRDTEPAVRCALASILAYVVQPRDLIPDNAPGGYGLLDDAVMVHAGYLNVPPPQAESEEPQHHEQYLRFLAGFMPKEVTTALQQTVQSLEMGLAFYRMLPVDMLETATQVMITNPLAPANGGSAGSKSSSVLLASRVTPTYKVSSERTVVKFPGGGAVAAHADGKIETVGRKTGSTTPTREKIPTFKPPDKAAA